ncbi:DNA replication/repair protein RecF [Caldicellulosiruptoraceae bacterium PP1]
MKIKRLYLENFRLYEKEEFEFDKSINIISGANASGKTSILEAIYFCLYGKSFKSRDIDAIKFDKDYFSLNLYLNMENHTSVKSNVYVEKSGLKRIIINEKKINKLSELIDKFNLILFQPNSVNLIKGDPSIRRRFLDMIMIKIYPHMFFVVSDFNKVIQNRNAFLKSNSKNDIIDVYDQELSILSESIINKRIEIIKRISECFNFIFNFLIDENQNISIEYKNSLKVFDKQEIYKILINNRKKDTEMKYTTKGPHRDDFEVYINNKNSKIFASEGQIKLLTIALILSIAEITQDPILLLDDIFSELDIKKRNKVIEFCQKYQTFITTTDDNFEGKIYYISRM